MSLSPAAAALEADLCLLTRLPLPKEADLDAIKERVFGSVEGVPRTEDASRRRYVDPIVQAFNAAGVTRIEQFPERVRRLIVRSGTVIAERDDALDDLRRVREEYDALRQERDDARAALAKAHERIERLQEINERLEARNREATQAGASFGVETCGLLAEKDAEIRDLRIECDRAIAGRDKAVTELEDMRERERIARADAVHCHQEMRTLRTDLAATRKHHADLTAAHAKLAADATWRDKHIDLLDNSLANARREAKAAHDALTAEQGRSERLRAVMVDLIADLNAAKEGGE